MKTHGEYFLLPMEKGAFYGIKNDWADKKVRFQNRRGQFEYHLNKWRLRLTGCKWGKIGTEKTIHYLEDYRYWNRDIGLYVQLVA